jgi:hypothetical protein
MAELSESFASVGAWRAGLGEQIASGYGAHGDIFALVLGPSRALSKDERKKRRGGQQAAQLRAAMLVDPCAAAAPRAASSSPRSPATSSHAAGSPRSAGAASSATGAGQAAPSTAIFEQVLGERPHERDHFALDEPPRARGGGSSGTGHSGGRPAGRASRGSAAPAARGGDRGVSARSAIEVKEGLARGAQAAVVKLSQAIEYRSRGDVLVEASYMSSDRTIMVGCRFTTSVIRR